MNDRLTRLLAGSALSLAVGTAAAVGTQAAAAPADAAEPAALRFDIDRFDVRGNTLLPADRVAALLAPFTGHGRDFGDIQRALEALEDAYRAHGYTMVLASLPEQELAQGVVRIDVLQTTVGAVRVTGNRYVDEANVRRALPALREGSTPNLTALGASLKVANENPARRLDVQLAGGAVDGEVDATVNVTDESPWQAVLNADNTGTGASGKTHAGVILQNANLWGRDHVLSLQYTTAPGKHDQIGIYGLGYHMPLYALGDSLDVFASYANVDSGNVTAGVFDLAVSGRGATAGLRYNRHLARRGNRDGRLIFGLDYKAYRNSLQMAGVELGGNVTVHPLSAAYVGTWTLARGEASLGLTLVRNVSGGRNGGAADVGRARSGGAAGYGVLRLSAVLDQVLPADWRWRAILNGQYTADALVPGEQFGLGGAASVRGFDERIVTNDVGATLNLETYTPSWCGASRFQCRGLTFYDLGWARRNHALPRELDSTTLAAAGVGLRLTASRYANLQLDYAHVLEPGATARRDANRLHFRLSLSY